MSPTLEQERIRNLQSGVSLTSPPAPVSPPYTNRIRQVLYEVYPVLTLKINGGTKRWGYSAKFISHLRQWQENCYGLWAECAIKNASLAPTCVRDRGIFRRGQHLYFLWFERYTLPKSKGMANEGMWNVGNLFRFITWCF